MELANEEGRLHGVLKKSKRHLINFSEGKQKSVIFTVRLRVINIPCNTQNCEETISGLLCPFFLLVVGKLPFNIGCLNNNNMSRGFYGFFKS